MAVNYGSLPFQEQIDFHQAKNLVPTEHWYDLEGDAHKAGFMVAGATKADLLSDLKEAVRKATENGDTLKDFRKNFDSIVEKRGWTGWTGSDSDAGVAWRTRVIYETNLRASYQAGRWEQAQLVKKTRPYVIYRHSDLVKTARETHKLWDGKVLSIDDPWVKAHWPIKEYGCKCEIDTLSERDLQKMGKTGPDSTPDDGAYEWTHPQTGEVRIIPKGVGPSFHQSNIGDSLADSVRKQLEKKLPTLPVSIAKQLASRLDNKAAMLAKGAGATSFDKARDFVLKMGRDMKKNNQADIEFAYAYDETGKVLVKRRGVKDKVKFTAEDIAKLQEAKGVTIVHNHPGDGVSLSYGDLLFSHRVDAETYAISHHDGVYYSGRVLDIDRLQRQYKNIETRTEELLDNLIGDAKISVAAADFYQFHLLNAALAELGIIHYSAIGFATPAALAMVLEKLVQEFK